MNKKDELKIIKKIIKYLLYSYKNVIVVCICFFTVTCFSFFRPLIIKVITDEGMGQKNSKLILVYATSLLLLSLIEQFLELLQVNLFIDIQNQLQLELYNRVFEKLLKVHMDYYVKRTATQIVNQMSTDINMVSAVADRTILFMFNYIMHIISGIIGLFLINEGLALIVIAVIPVKFICVQQLADMRKTAMQKCIEENNTFISWFGDQINGIKEIKLWNLYKQKTEVLVKTEQEVLKASKRNMMIDAYNMAIEIILEWGLISVLYAVGGIMVCKSNLTIGGMVAFLSYSSYVTGPISSIFNIQLIFSKIVPSARRLFEFLDEETEEECGHLKLSQNFERMTFQNVKFSFGDKRILNDGCFEIRRGEKIAFIGSNGSGKTTILNLLLRLLKPDEGKILIDDYDIQDICIEDYRELFSVVNQDAHLFQDTLENNVNLQRTGVYNICDLLLGFTYKGDKIIEPEGSNFSGGEKQKIALARAILKDAQIMIFDEVDNNLDLETQQKIINLIMEDLPEKTVIIVTHDPKYFVNLDKIYKIDNGTIILNKG